MTGRARALLLAAPALLAIGVFMALPMGIALVTSFLTPTPYGGVTRPFTGASYLRFLYDRDLDDALVFDWTYPVIFARSLVQAALTSLVCLILGLPLAWYMATRRPALRRVLVLLVTIPFWTNLLIRTYCWVLLLRDQGLVNQALMGLHLTGALAHVVFCVPFAMLPIRARLREMPRDVEDAAHDLYADRGQVFSRITLPLLMPAIVAGATLAFVVSLDDFLITLMVAPAGATTLPVYLYGMLRLGVTPEANAAASLLLAVSLAAVVLAYGFASRQRAGWRVGEGEPSR